MTAVEAMPFVQATQEDLADVVADLLADGVGRRTVGEESRAFAERHHDSVRFAENLVEVYRALRGT